MSDEENAEVRKKQRLFRFFTPSQWTQEQRDAMDDDGYDDTNIRRSIVRMYETSVPFCFIHAYFLYILYPSMFCAGVFGVLLPCIWPNTVLHVVITMAIVIVSTVLHISFKLMQCCVSGMAVYPKEPVLLYMTADLILITMTLSSLTAYIMDLVYGLVPSAFMPMLASWVVALVGMLNFNLTRLVLLYGPDELGGVTVKARVNWLGRFLAKVFLSRDRF